VFFQQLRSALVPDDELGGPEHKPAEIELGC
jgi:hypothetical protein